ncbi:general secretion pathway protein GspE [Archangium minus]|uniref:General secretion pathway protein GspE n=1 Tax=Archangium minus TaxID=83450 RepID=A0ABY9WRQ6_9BACT|nr:general secretion pathway protein GspE [Archangium minus]
MRKKIGELLIESGAVSQEQIRHALGQQRAYGNRQRLGSVIITLGFASPAAVARALAHQFELPFVQLPEIPEQVRSLVSLDFQAEHRIVLFKLEREGRSERLHVAVDDPSDLTVADELSFQLNKPVRVHVAAEDDLDRALDLVSGRAVDALPLGDDDGSPFDLQHGNLGELPGNWHDAAETTPPSPSAALSALLDWEPPPPPPATPRSALTSKPPMPPAPPPFDEEDEDITLITPRVPSKPKASALPPPPPPQESEDVLDELLGEPEPPAPRPSAAPAEPNKKGAVPVVVFGGAAQGLPQPPPPPQLPDITDEDLKVLEDIERMADGAEATLHTEKVKPARMVASLIRLLIRKRVIREEEFLEELSRK